MHDAIDRAISEAEEYGETMVVADLGQRVDGSRYRVWHKAIYDRHAGLIIGCRIVYTAEPKIH